MDLSSISVSFFDELEDHEFMDQRSHIYIFTVQ